MDITVKDALTFMKVARGMRIISHLGGGGHNKVSLAFLNPADYALLFAQPNVWRLDNFHCHTKSLHHACTGDVIILTVINETSSLSR